MKLKQLALIPSFLAVQPKDHSLCEVQERSGGMRHHFHGGKTTEGGQPTCISQTVSNFVSFLSNVVVDV